MEHRTDREADRGRAEADRDHLQTATAPVPYQRRGRINADAEENERAQRDGQDYRRIRPSQRKGTSGMRCPMSVAAMITAELRSASCVWTGQPAKRCYPKHAEH